MNANLNKLIGKLNSTCKRALEAAISHCVQRRHFEVELEHLYLALLDMPGSDFFLLLKCAECDTAALEADLLQQLGSCRSGNSRTPVFSEHLPTLLEHAWLLASIDGDGNRIRSGHLLTAALTVPVLASLSSRASMLLSETRGAEIGALFSRHAADYPESLDSDPGAQANTRWQAEPLGRVAQQAPFVERRAAGGFPGMSGGSGFSPALDRFTENLTLRARNGEIDPVVGRDREIRQLINILVRRRQNNPILTGDAGVGKTAVVEGLAQRIADGDVPAQLRNVAIHMLDLGLLQAGAGVKGEFENRLRGLIEEIGRAGHPVILFIDEAHALIGAGGQAGQSDAANLLKPALARGGLRTIAATTWSEYKRYFEKDAALARRFQVVRIEEPSEEVACVMLRGIARKMEDHFNVRILDEALVEAVRLAARYITGRQLPDKAVSVLDTACARVALAQNAAPAAMDDARRRCDALLNEIAVLEQEVKIGIDHAARLDALRTRHAEARAALTACEDQWHQEKALVDSIRHARSETGCGSAPDEAARVAPYGMAEEAGVPYVHGDKDGITVPGGDRQSSTLAQLRHLNDSLNGIRKETPLVPVDVDRQVVAEVVAAWTGIPLGRMLKDDFETILNLKSRLGQRVVGQDHAIDEVARCIRTARANIGDPGKPAGAFLFVGPSGVGKTETALALAEALYGGERKLVTINMSEYQEAHSVSGLKGAPPGYVGFGAGGVLTEAVRRAPHGIVLLDEIEKAHPDVLELFFQVLDKGVLEDAEGRETDFRNTILILTSNVATQAIMQACLCSGDGEMPDVAVLSDLVRPELYEAFQPAFLGRVKVIPFYPLSDDALEEIIRLKLARIGQRIHENHQAAFAYDERIVDVVLDRCFAGESGARNIDHYLNGMVLPDIAETLLVRLAQGNPVKGIRIDVDAEAGMRYEID